MSNSQARPVDTARQIPDPGFAGDTGVGESAVLAALAAYGREPTTDRYAAALATIATSRLLVPVVAVLGEAETGADGLVRDKSADMAAVLLRGADGRQALLAFTGLDALTAWDPQARPVPVKASQAALAAVQEDASALVIDVAGPVRLVVEGDHLGALAAGYRLVRVGEQWGWVGEQPPAE